jgi:hypothetical protein
MHAFAMIHWGYITVAILSGALLVAAPFFLVVFRSSRTIAHTSTDDFRLRNANIWTEPDHTPDGGSLQLMRLRDGHFVLVSVGISTVKVFTTPERSDVTKYRELTEFPMQGALERLSQSSQERHAEDLLFLDRVRRAMGWPDSVSDLVSSLQSIDDSLLLRATPNA